MSGPAHYREAERLLAWLDATGDDEDQVVETLAAAQVHATLALAAATAYPAMRVYWLAQDPVGDEDLATPAEWAWVAS
jgi:hypothetical protein